MSHEETPESPVSGEKIITDKDVKSLEHLYLKAVEERKKIQERTLTFQKNLVLKMEKVREERSRMSEHVELLQRENQKMTSKMDELNVRISDLTEQRSSLSSKVQEKAKFEADTTFNQKTIECLTAQLYQMQLAQDQFVNVDIDALLKEKDAVIADLHARLSAQDVKTTEVTNQLDESVSSRNRMTARLEENKKVLESMKQTLEFQKQVSAEKLRVVDEKYSAVKKINRRVYQRVLELEKELYAKRDGTEIRPLSIDPLARATSEPIERTEKPPTSSIQNLIGSLFYRGRTEGTRDSK